MKVSTSQQQALFCTSLIRTTSSAGTGFVFRASPPGTPEIWVLVTNKHVVAEQGPGSFTLQAREDAGPKLGEWVEFTHPELFTQWVGHPNDDVDIAAMFLMPFLKDLPSMGKAVYFNAIDESLFPTQDILDDLDVLEPVAFFGYPNELYDLENLTPIARRGHTASPIMLDYDGDPSFLIDASVFGGSSGSPVFIHQSNGFTKGGNFYVGGSRFIFVGILAAVFLQKDNGKLVTKVEAANVEIDQVMDLGIVYNWRAVKETVEALFAAARIQYGTTAALGDVSGVQVTTQVDPPEQPS